MLDFEESKAHTAFDSSEVAAEIKLKRTRVQRTPRRQKLVNQIIETPELLDSLAAWAQSKRLRGSAKKPLFKSLTPPKVEATVKHSLRTKSTNAVVRPRPEEENKRQQVALYQRVLRKLPSWIAALRSSSDRHRFGLKCFGFLYKHGVWLESVDGGPWIMRGKLGRGLPPESIQEVGSSAYAVDAMETHKIMTASTEWLPEVFGSERPVHFFVIEKPTVEKRSLYCFYGSSTFTETQQFVLRSALYEFQKDY